jgi:hypothetical protein
MRDLRLPAGVAQGGAPHPDRDAIPAKHPGVPRTRAFPTIQHLPQRSRDRQHAARPRLGPARGQPNDPALQVHFVPGEFPDLIPAPARVIRKVEHVLIRRGRVGPDLQVLVVLEEPLAGWILFQPVRKQGHAFQEPAPDPR